jgi:hypothetical protein
LNHLTRSAVALLFVFQCSGLLAQRAAESVKTPSTQTSGKQQQPTAELAEICTLPPNKTPHCVNAQTAKSTVSSKIDRASNHFAAPSSPGKSSKCAWLLPADPDGRQANSPGKITAPDASTIANLLGSPYPYAAIAPDGKTLLVYRISPNARDVSPYALSHLNQEILSLFDGVAPSSTAQTFQVEFAVPHQAALGDLATQLQSLNPDLTIQDVGKEMVRVTASSGAPDCKTWEAFVDNLHRIAWSVHPESPVDYVFFHEATDVSNALAGTNAAGTPILLAGTSPSSGGGAGGASTNGPSGSGSLGGGGSAAGGGGAGSSSASATPAASGGGGTGAGGGGSTGASSTSASSTSNGGATVSISQPAGTTTTLSMVSAPTSGAGGLPTISSNGAGAKPGGSSGANPAAGAAPASAANPAAASGSGAGSAAIPKPAITQAALGANDIIFSDNTNGDDAAITERKRIIAAVDLPRPEMLINTWILQQSTNDAKLSENVIDDVRRTVEEQNDGLQTAILAGWDYLSGQMATPKTYFDLPFYNYVVPRVMFNPSAYAPPPAPLSAGEIVTRVLRDQDVLREKGPGIFYDTAQYGHEDLVPLGYCPTDRYCLGYTTLFQPLQPNLTTLMLALIAADQPFRQAAKAIDSAEESDYWSLKKTCPKCDRFSFHLDGFKNKTVEDKHPDSEWTKLIQSVLYAEGFSFKPDDDLMQGWLDQETDCGRADQKASLWFLYHRGERPVFFLECFRRAFQLAQEGIVPCLCPPGQSVPPPACPPAGERGQSIPPGKSRIFGQARAAIADFLYHYKMSVQYPHEFAPYDLTHSAEEMNKSVRPFIDAFNRDLAAYQQISQYLLNAKTDGGGSKEWFGSGKGRFNYNALVSVHTISGSEAIVDTTTESYLDTLSMPTLAGLLSSLNSALPEASSSGGSNGATTTTSTTTTNGSSTTTSSTTQPVVPTSKPAKPQGILSNLSLNQAQVLAGAIGAFQPNHAHIGRQTTVDVLPESLSGASSAELQVALHSADGANPPSFVWSAPGGPSDPEVSRFSNSSISTRIRVDSVKMFEVASFSAELLTSRKNIPIAPVPLVQLPYVGSVFSIPLHPAREFHSNIAVMSAVIIPTATDLASGIRFVADRLVEPPPLGQKLGCYWPPYGAHQPSPAYPHLCKLRPAIALSDLADQPIREFHRKVIYCLSTGMMVAESNLLDGDDVTGQAECNDLTFSEVPADAN